MDAMVIMGAMDAMDAMGVGCNGWIAMNATDEVHWMNDNWLVKWQAIGHLASHLACQLACQPANWLDKWLANENANCSPNWIMKKSTLSLEKCR